MQHFLKLSQPPHMEVHTAAIIYGSMKERKIPGIFNSSLHLSFFSINYVPQIILVIERKTLKVEIQIP